MMGWRFQIFALLWLGLALSAHLHGQGLPADWEGRVIDSVESEALSERDLAQLRNALGLRVGTPLHLERLEAAIQQLSQGGKWSRVFVHGKLKRGHIVLRLQGARVRRLRDLNFDGVSDDVLTEVRQKFRAQTDPLADAQSFALLRQALKESLEERGFFLSKVEFSTTIVDDEQADVGVSVASGEVTRVNRVIVRGAGDEENLRMQQVFSLQRGQAFIRARVNTGIEAIHAYLRSNQYPTSRVIDTVIDFTADKRTVDITVLVRMGERIQIRFFGNQVFGDVALRGLLSDEVLAQSDPALRISQLIELKYRSVGYPDAQVEIKRSVVGDGSLTLIEMHVQEGERVLISALRFSSGDEVGSVHLPSLFLENASGVLRRRLYWPEGIAPTLAAMQSQLLSMGYLNSRIAEPKVTFSEDRRSVVLFFDADLGVQTRLTRVDFIGLQHLTSQQLTPLLAFKLDEPLNKSQVIETGTRIVAHLADSGFPQGRLVRPAEESIELSRDQRSAVVRFEVEEGQRFTIKDVSVEGLRKTQKHVVMRELEIATGDLYRTSLVRQSEENLALLGLFSRVEIAEKPNTDQPGRMDLKVMVRESQPGAGEFGLGGLYEQPRLRIRPFAGLTYRNVSGLNQTATLRGELGLPVSREQGNLTVPFIEYSSIAGYRYPYVLGIPVAFATQLSFDRVEVQPAEQTLQTRARVEGRLEKRFSSKLTAIYRLIRVERTTTESLMPLNPESAVPITESIGSTGPGLILDLRDDIFNPSRGSFHALELELAHPLMFSQSNIAFLLGLLRNSFYLRLGSATTFAFAANLGYAHSLFDGEPLARARLVNELALGGQGSIRGIAPRRLSPPLTAQDMAFYNARAELTFGVFGDFGFAVFVDSGQIFPDFKPLARSDGIGIGLRYKTPVGPVVIDFAQGLGELRENVMFYFTVGTI